MCFVLKAPTPVPGVMEAASSCAFTWAAVVEPAPVPMAVWQTMVLSVSAMKVIYSTPKGLYWKASTFQMKMTSTHPFSPLKTQLFLRTSLRWPLTTARPALEQTASFLVMSIMEIYKLLMMTGPEELLSQKVSVFKSDKMLPCCKILTRKTQFAHCIFVCFPRALYLWHYGICLG